MNEFKETDYVTPITLEPILEPVIDNINHPRHYTQGKIECIEVTEQMPFLEGSAIKYLWRHKFKNGAEDIKKAIWYCKRILKTQYNEEV